MSSSVADPPSWSDKDRDRNDLIRPIDNVRCVLPETECVAWLVLVPTPLGCASSPTIKVGDPSSSRSSSSSMEYVLLLLY